MRNEKEKKTERDEPLRLLPTVRFGRHSSQAGRGEGTGGRYRERRRKIRERDVTTKEARDAGETGTGERLAVIRRGRRGGGAATRAKEQRLVLSVPRRRQARLQKEGLRILAGVTFVSNLFLGASGDPLEDSLFN